MLLRHFLLLGIFFFSGLPTLKSEIIATVRGDAILAYTDQFGKAGYSGCKPDNLKEAPAYIFQLEYQMRNSSACRGSGSSNGWRTVSEKPSSDGSVFFNQLPEGRYRIISLTGEAIGCQRADGSKSIVYTKELSRPYPIGLDGKEKEKLSPNSEGIEALLVFPNPASQKITVQLRDTKMKGSVTIDLVNPFGQSLRSLKDNLTEDVILHTWTMEVGAYPPGVYFIRIRADKGRQLQKKFLVIKSN